MSENVLMDVEEYFHAALIFQRGESLEEIWQAHTLASRAAALDRWLMYHSRPQKYGTQFFPDGRTYRLWEVEPTTTDADRAAWNVPSLEEQTKRAQLMTLTMSQPPMDDAPWWLKEALHRWSLQTDESSHP